VKEYWSAGVSPASCFFAGGTSALHHEKHLSSSRVVATTMIVGVSRANPDIKQLAREYTTATMSLHFNAALEKESSIEDQRAQVGVSFAVPNIK
jgi:hypothetical protein